jgi:putative addiction module killer protein
MPFRDWRLGLTDKRLKAAVDARITRLRLGIFGDSKPVGDGVLESRIDFGPGYRIYYAVNGEEVLLLRGGEKGSQRADIIKAKSSLADHRKRIWEKKKN